MKLNICVIDDEESIRDTFKWHLEDQGHKVTVFECPDEMIKHCDTCSSRETPCFDVLFVDNNMPSIFGLDFLNYSTLPHCKLPANRKILMSGALSAQAMKHAHEKGFRTYQKPLRLHVLNEILDKIAG